MFFFCIRFKKKESSFWSTCRIGLSWRVWGIISHPMTMTTWRGFGTCLHEADLARYAVRGTLGHDCCRNRYFSSNRFWTICNNYTPFPTMMVHWGDLKILHDFKVETFQLSEILKSVILIRRTYSSMHFKVYFPRLWLNKFFLFGNLVHAWFMFFPITKAILQLYFFE